MLADGFGFVDTQTPELAFAVLPEFRNQGIGTHILNQLLNEIAKLYPQVSLSVREDNPAISLYERIGFSKIEGSESTNIAGSISFKMVKKLEEKIPEPQKESLEERQFKKSFQY